MDLFSEHISCYNQSISSRATENEYEAICVLVIYYNSVESESYFGKAISNGRNKAKSTAEQMAYYKFISSCYKFYGPPRIVKNSTPKWVGKSNIRSFPNDKDIRFESHSHTSWIYGTNLLVHYNIVVHYNNKETVIFFGKAIGDRIGNTIREARKMAEKCYQVSLTELIDSPLEVIHTKDDEDIDMYREDKYGHPIRFPMRSPKEELLMHEKLDEELEKYFCS